MKELITIENVPEELYVELDNETNKKLWNSVLPRTVIEISKELSIPIRNLYKYKERSSGYPLGELKKITNLAKMNLVKIVLKTQRDSKRLEIKLPVKCSIEFSEFLGHLLGDGGIDQQLQVHYTTNDKRFLDRFDLLISKIFGKVDKKIYDYGTRKTYYYPKILGIILKSLGFPEGNKVDSNIEIPDDVLVGFNNQMKIAFIRAFYECDGDSKQIRIVQGGKINKKPNILIQIQKMLNELGFKSIVVEPSSVYVTAKGKRRRWVLKIKDKDEKNKFKQIIIPTKLL